jgi:hypothetical protein
MCGVFNHNDQLGCFLLFDDDRAGICAADHRYVIKFLVAEGVSVLNFIDICLQKLRRMLAVFGPFTHF